MPVRMGVVRVLPVSFLALTASFAFVLGARAQPQIPATYFGSVTVDGAPAAAGTEIRGLVDGLDCTQAPPGQQPVFIDGEIAAYVLYVVHESQRPGCAREGSRVNFTIGGRPAVQTAVWAAGPARLDLSTGAASPIPLPSPTNTSIAAAQTPPVGASAGPPGTGTASTTGTAARPTGTPPTDDVRFDQTPLPPGATPPNADDDGDSGGSPIWLILAGTLLVLAGGAGAAGYFLSRKHRQPPGDAAS